VHDGLGVGRLALLIKTSKYFRGELAVKLLNLVVVVETKTFEEKLEIFVNCAVL